MGIESIEDKSDKELEIAHLKRYIELRKETLQEGAEGLRRNEKRPVPSSLRGLFSDDHKSPQLDTYYQGIVDYANREIEKAEEKLAELETE